MGLREKLNENPAITTGATIAIIVIAVGFIIFSALPSGGPRIPNAAYYTVDEGDTLFTADVNKVAPFDKDGKPAVLAHVFTCGDKEFVAYLERYTPEAKKQLEAIQTEGAKPSPELGMRRSQISMTGRQYKKPKVGKWISMTEDYNQFNQMMNINCPDKAQIPEPKMP